MSGRPPRARALSRHPASACRPRDRAGAAGGSSAGGGGRLMRCPAKGCTKSVPTMVGTDGSSMPAHGSGARCADNHRSQFCAVCGRLVAYESFVRADARGHPAGHPPRQQGRRESASAATEAAAGWAGGGCFGGGRDSGLWAVPTWGAPRAAFGGGGYGGGLAASGSMSCYGGTTRMGAAPERPCAAPAAAGYGSAPAAAGYGPAPAAVGYGPAPAARPTPAPRRGSFPLLRSLACDDISDETVAESLLLLNRAPPAVYEGPAASVPPPSWLLPPPSRLLPPPDMSLHGGAHGAWGYYPRTMSDDSALGALPAAPGALSGSFGGASLSMEFEDA